MNLKFVFRGVLFAVPVALLALMGGVVVLFWTGRLTPPLDPTPPPPTILSPPGEIPDGPIGLREWAQYLGEGYTAMSCGFLFRLADGTVIGATVAHSHSIGDPAHPLERIAFSAPGEQQWIAEFDTLRGYPGYPRSGDDMRVDYILVQTDARLDAAPVLSPDPRGAPQPGERVALFSGLHGRSADGTWQRFNGTVQSVSEQAIWVVMDDLFMPGNMSGSPFVSHHTGNVVGMLIAGAVRGNRLVLAAHPIGSLVSLAENAQQFPKIRDFRR